MNQSSSLSILELVGHEQETNLIEIENKDANCRLRNGLNEDCLVEIFKYLDTKDLFNLGLMNNYYQQIINEYVIPKCHLKLYGKFINPYNNNIVAVLRMYGKNVKYLEIYDLWNVSSLYLCIIAYCSIDHLQSLTLHFDDDTFGCTIFPNPELLANMIPYFRQIKMLDLRLPGQMYDFLPVIEPSEALQILKLDRSSNNILKNPRISISELHLGSLREYYVDCRNIFQFIIQRRPQLKCFSTTKTFEIGDLNFLGGILADYCGDSIKSFQDVSEDYHMTRRIGNYSKYEYTLIEAMVRYSFLSYFNCLKELTITTMFNFRDLYRFLPDLAKIDKLEKLDIRMLSVTTEKSILKWKLHERHTFLFEPEILKTFTNLKKISFELPKYFRDMNFFIKYISKLMPEIQTIYIRKCLNKKCLEILKLFPKLRKIYINRLLVEPRNIVNLESIVAQCENHGKIQIFPSCAFEFEYL